MILKNNFRDKGADFIRVGKSPLQSNFDRFCAKNPTGEGAVS